MRLAGHQRRPALDGALDAVTQMVGAHLLQPGREVQRVALAGRAGETGLQAQQRACAEVLREETPRVRHAQHAVHQRPLEAGLACHLGIQVQGVVVARGSGEQGQVHGVHGAGVQLQGVRWGEGCRDGHHACRWLRTRMVWRLRATGRADTW